MEDKIVDVKEVEKLLGMKDKYQKQLSITEAKLEELEEDVKESRKEVIELFGTDDTTELDAIGEKLLSEAKELINIIESEE